MTSAIILASGAGLRFQNEQPKQFMKLAGMPVMVHAIKVFQSCDVIDEILVVCHDSYINEMWNIVNRYELSKVTKVLSGGATRQESSYIGLRATDANCVLVHDSVRPFLSHQVINRLVEAVSLHKAVDTVIPSADTLVEVDDDGFIANIPDRSRFRRGQTPQAFERSLVLQAHEQAVSDGIENATDDCQLVMRLGHKVFCVDGDDQNIKITYPLDLHIADKLFQLRSQSVLPVDEKQGMFFNGRVALVFGGMSGIGACVSTQLKASGCRVYVCSRHSSPAVDVSRLETVEVFIKHVLQQEEQIDFVVNCAGDLIRCEVAFMTPEQWHYLYAVNVEGAFNVAKAVLPQLQKQQSGVMLFVGSSSYTRGRSGYAAYSSCKAALVNFVQALAEEVASADIRVNIASPGRVKTGLRERHFGKEPEDTLLSPEFVAEKILAALISPMTGGVFDIS
jgi:2-C-methyl-D-erythritol 4-phosphate cytidylyltransferase